MSVIILFSITSYKRSRIQRRVCLFEIALQIVSCVFFVKQKEREGNSRKQKQNGFCIILMIKPVLSDSLHWKQMIGCVNI